MSLPEALTRIEALEALAASTRADLEATEAMAEMARDEATSSETKAEGKYDTRATEASYLARGQAWRILELRRLLTWLESLSTREAAPSAEVEEGSLVWLESRGQRRWVLIAPVGGARAEVQGASVQAISLQSPMGEELDGLEAGEDFELEVGRGLRAYRVLSIS